MTWLPELQWPVRCSCGVVYPAADWVQLKLVGHQVESTEVLELRDCAACGSTISIRGARGSFR